MPALLVLPALGALPIMLSNGNAAIFSAPIGASFFGFLAAILLLLPVALCIGAEGFDDDDPKPPEGASEATKEFYRRIPKRDSYR